MSHPLVLHVVINSAAAVDETWTTVHLACAAASIGVTVRFIEAQDHEVTSRGRLMARAQVLQPGSVDRVAVAHSLRNYRLPRVHTDLEAGDIILLRVNPFTAEALRLALLAEERGVPVINNPKGVERTRSKAWLATLRDVPRPATLVTASRGSAEWFARRLGTDIVVKPVDRSGGRGVCRIPYHRLDLLDQAMDLAWCSGDSQVVVQEYLPEAAEGEKRLFWVDGHILGAYLRLRGWDGFRHNLAQGGRPQPCTVDETDRAIARAIGRHLRRNGIRIAGLDVIGGRLVEVNTLNPGGIHYAECFRDPARPSIAAEAVRLLLPHTSRLKALEAGSP